MPVLARIHAEEALLHSYFGAEYDAYCAHTSRLIRGLPRCRLCVVQAGVRRQRGVCVVSLRPCRLGHAFRRRQASWLHTYLPAIHPPSIGNAAPLMFALWGPHTNMTNAVTLSSVTKRRGSWRALRYAVSASSRDVPSRHISAWMRTSVAGVSTLAGQIALQVILVRAHSNATARVNPGSAVFVVTKAMRLTVAKCP